VASDTNDKTLKGKVAWITGGATGMGRAAALRLANSGVAIAIGSLTEDLRGNLPSDRQTAYTPAADILEKSAAEIRSRGVDVLALPLDITDEASLRRSHDAITSELGPVDILINAAGNSGRHAMVDHPDSLWQAMLDVNLTGSYSATKLCLPGMIERGWGRIVNFSSTAGLIGAENHAAYCAAKTGLLGLTRCVALEGAPHGVTCNAICPGWVASDQNYVACLQEMEIAGIKDKTVEEFRQMMAEKWVPQNRFLEPDEPGALAAFLCGEDARGITGEALRVSAGSLW
jgi:NAD(P)-dependent dehydrogenase (short-subunit alcohol dehydrogenase family)